MLIVSMLLVVILIAYLKAKHATERLNHSVDSSGWTGRRRSH